jgi:hypothetical protein
MDGTGEACVVVHLAVDRWCRCRHRKKHMLISIYILSFHLLPILNRIYFQGAGHGSRAV